MKQLRVISALACTALCFFFSSCPLRAQQKPEEEIFIGPLNPAESYQVYNFTNGTTTAYNGVIIRYAGTVLTAREAALNRASDEVLADGNVRIQQGDQLWVSEHVLYNFKTHQLQSSQFRTGQSPIFAAGRDLRADVTNHVYYATNTLVTAEDVYKPGTLLRAKRIKLIPGRKIVAYDAVLYVEGVPVFYFPYYSRDLGEHASHFNVLPGYRSLYGPFLLGSYSWYLNENLDGVAHLDYREKRGPGAGLDLNYHMGKWGDGSFQYYYTHDSDPNIDQLGVPIPDNRQRLVATYQANPATNLNVKGVAYYESDPAMDRDFFENAYVRDPQPKTFLEANKFWQNFNLDVYGQPRVNYFLETVERLPDVRLTGYRQEIGSTPLYYESQSSVGYYRRDFAENVPTNTFPPGLNYEAARADTYHQIIMPETLFGWLNVIPRVGGRFTYYSQATGPGATSDEEDRGVFNTGAEINFKASQTWPEVQSSLFDVNGLRHIIQPSVNYVFVPAPTTAPQLLPQFDYELPSLRLLPIDFPEYDAIDSIDSQNVIRWGLNNKLQTKREGQIVDVVNWDLYLDWRLTPRPDQTTFSDLYSDLTFRPRSWLSLESIVRYDIDGDDLRMSYTTLTLFPSSRWSWSLGHYYLRSDLSGLPTSLGPGNDIVSSTLTYRLNENWGFRMAHYFNVDIGSMQQQAYTIYRDLRSWTAALTFITRANTIGPEDFTVAFTFSLKSFPRLPPGGDVAGATALLAR